MNTAIIEQKLTLVPDEYLNEISEYIDFILFRAHEKNFKKFKRTPGIMNGEICMSDDFDAPLDDFKEYM
ncbi:MAG: DUF2281 domain-containing protein [Selenomonadaceae bacterium]|nr:DUF2281 domain-containing protein [Selenomonadaceae bacterium]